MSQLDKQHLKKSTPMPAKGFIEKIAGTDPVFNSEYLKDNVMTFHFPPELMQHSAL